MAPSTLILTLRQKRREAKRLGRSQAIRSTLRASTLRTEETILEKEKEEKELAGRKGRKAMHEGGEARGVRPLTQAELIAEALEEEERNRESLRDWVRREEERRELRRVGRKRVRGPRWTWISRTVGKLVEEVGGEETVQERPAKINKRLDGGETSDNTPVPAPEAISVDKPDEPQPSDTVGEGEVDGTAVEHVSKAVDPPNTTASNGLTNGVSQGHVEATVQPPESAAQSSPPQQLPRENPTSPDAAATTPDQRNANPAKPPETTSRSSVAPQLPPEIPDSAAQYARNYLILSQVPGGLPAELALVLGDHVHWDEMQYIPHRNRPISQSFNFLERMITDSDVLQIADRPFRRSVARPPSTGTLPLASHTRMSRRPNAYKHCLTTDTYGVRRPGAGSEERRTWRLMEPGIYRVGTKQFVVAGWEERRLWRPKRRRRRSWRT